MQFYLAIGARRASKQHWLMRHMICRMQRSHRHPLRTDKNKRARADHPARVPIKICACPRRTPCLSCAMHHRKACIAGSRRECEHAKASRTLQGTRCTLELLHETAYKYQDRANSIRSRKAGHTGTKHVHSCPRSCKSFKEGAKASARTIDAFGARAKRSIRDRGE